ncbi:MAG: heme o synthase [Pseudomonadota bacterium]
MKSRTDTDHPVFSPALADYLALLKFRLLSLVLVSTCMGFFISADAQTPLLPLIFTLLGITLVGGGANCLNQWIERDADSRMLRTRLRPLPTLRLTASNALLFGLLISLCGFVLIGWQVNQLTLWLSFVSWSSYLLIYTPLKSRSPLNTWVGAVPGAIPAILGCTAAVNTLTADTLALFLILYVWQMPHFFAISWVYRDDYLRGGFRMLSWNDESGRRTAIHILLHTVLLVPISAGLYLAGSSGLFYLASTILSSLVFLHYALQFYRDPSKAAAKKVFHYSIVWLPLLFATIMLDRLLRSIAF